MTVDEVQILLFTLRVSALAFPAVWASEVFLRRRRPA
jgi:hypothetical protein